MAALAPLVAAEVRALLTEDRRPAPVDAATLAELLGVSRDYIYSNAGRLGAVRLGDGPRARLRFDPEAAREAFDELRACQSSKQSVTPVAPPDGAQRRTRQRRRSSRAQSVPTGGES